MKDYINFRSSGEAYDACNSREEMHTGRIFTVEAEQIVEREVGSGHRIVRSTLPESPATEKGAPEDSTTKMSWNQKSPPQ